MPIEAFLLIGSVAGFCVMYHEMFVAYTRKEELLERRVVLFRRFVRGGFILVGSVVGWWIAHSVFDEPRAVDAMFGGILMSFGATFLYAMLVSAL